MLRSYTHPGKEKKTLQKRNNETLCRDKYNCPDAGKTKRPVANKGS